MAPLKEELLVALAAALRELADAGLPFALVGGLAMGVRADPRVTRDIDFALPASDDDQAEAQVFALQQRGFIVDSVFVRKGGRISTVRTRHRSAPEILIDFLLSNALIEDVIVAEATSATIARDIRCPVAQPWHLLAMKVYANRKKDQPDLHELIERADRRTLARTKAALEMMRARGVAPARDLIAELGRHVRAVRSSRFERPSTSGRASRILRRNRSSP